MVNFIQKLLILSSMTLTVVSCSQFKPEISTQAEDDTEIETDNGKPPVNSNPNATVKEFNFAEINSSNTPDDSITSNLDFALDSSDPEFIKIMTNKATSIAFQDNLKSWALPVVHDESLDEDSIHIVFSEDSYFNITDDVIEYKLPSMEIRSRFGAPISVDTNNDKIEAYTEGVVAIKQDAGTFVIVYNETELKARKFDFTLDAIGPCEGDCLAWGLVENELFYLTPDKLTWERTDLVLSLPEGTKKVSGTLERSSADSTVEFKYLYVLTNDLTILKGIDINHEHPSVQHKLSQNLVDLVDAHCLSCHQNATRIGWWFTFKTEAIDHLQQNTMPKDSPIDSPTKDLFYQAIANSVVGNE